MKTVGVLSLQGAVDEHIKMIETCGHTGVKIKRPSQLNEIDGLILPGGESTTMRRLMDKYEFTEPLRKSNLPMFGTCAGLIILAKQIEGEASSHLNKLDVTVRRNSFGRQVDSFEADLTVEGIEDSVNAVFIRAPHIVEAGRDVKVLSKYNDRIVAVEQGNILGVSFHPELTNSLALHEYFINKI